MVTVSSSGCCQWGRKTYQTVEQLQHFIYHYREISFHYWAHMGNNLLFSSPDLVKYLKSIEYLPQDPVADLVSESTVPIKFVTAPGATYHVCCNSCASATSFLFPACTRVGALCDSSLRCHIALNLTSLETTTSTTIRAASRPYKSVTFFPSITFTLHQSQTQT